MAIDSKQNLSDKYFRQASGETLNLSGDTVVSGKIRYADGMTPTGATDFISREFFENNIPEGYNSEAFDVDFSGKTTNDLIEGSGSTANLYFTEERVENLVPKQLEIFSPILDLSRNTTFRHQVGGPINFTLGANPVLGKKAIFILVADGLNRPTVGTGFIEKFDNYTNTQNVANRLYFEYVGNNTVFYEWTYIQ